MTWLAEQPTLITAARVGRMFRISPLDVLRATRDEWLMLTASALVVETDERKAAEESKRKGG